MDIEWSRQERAFRDEVQEFFATHLTDADCEPPVG